MSVLKKKGTKNGIKTHPSLFSNEIIFFERYYFGGDSCSKTT